MERIGIGEPSRHPLEPLIHARAVGMGATASLGRCDLGHSPGELNCGSFMLEVLVRPRMSEHGQRSRSLCGLHRSMR